jgi:pyruvate,water dikinase
MIGQLVRLKEAEGLYHLAPGAVRLSDAERGRRAFEAEVALPATAPQGQIEVAVLELADGAAVAEDTTWIELRRVGLPEHLYRLAHESSAAFGLLGVLILLATGLAVDFLGSWSSGRRPPPAVTALTGLVRGVADAAIPAHRQPRTREEVLRMHEKYRLFRSLLTLNDELLGLLSELEEESSWTSFRDPRVRTEIRALFDGAAEMVRVLNELTRDRYFDLANVVGSLRADVAEFMAKAPEREDSRLVLQLDEVDSRTARLVGGKATNLARLECDVGPRVPRSFAVTIEAYREFLAADGLAGELRTILAPARLDAPEDFRHRCELAQDLVQRARVPQAVVEAIRGAARACQFTDGEGLAVRSSAAGEDSELSFAGQFETLLNVPVGELPDAWKKVVASRYSPRAVFYRRAAGVAEVDTPMAVLVQRMVRARASGVLFTRQPDGAGLIVSAARGLGPDVSAGIASADQFVVSRSAPHRVQERQIARKPACLVSADGGGLTSLALDEGEQLRPALEDAEVMQLAEVAMQIERYFGTPQDIEWVFDEDRRLSILQARPLHAEKTRVARDEPPGDAPLLLRGGSPVWAGRAVGPVHVARTPEEEERAPVGALLVVPQLLPDCVRLLPRVCGIVVERGTVTGHAASILREFRMPSLFGVPGALEALVSGQMASLDVASRSVFAGVLWPELRGRLPVTLLGRRTMSLPDALSGKLTKLTGSAFLGTWACRSLHDVIRFAHEMAIQAMFDVGDRLLDSPVGGVKRLECPPPVYVHVLDLGDGLRPEAASRESVRVEDVVSVPFQGLWRGLGDPHFEPRHPEGPAAFGSVLANTMVDAGGRELGSPNYACVTGSYLNLASRQAYHFAAVDSFLCENQNNNHISMRLKGGGAGLRQRNLRAEFAAEVLRRNHFDVRVTGDLLNGWIRGLDRITGMDKLATVGRLLRFLARLDMKMVDEAQVKSCAEAFAEAEAAALEAQRVERGLATA